MRTPKSGRRLSVRWAVLGVVGVVGVVVAGAALGAWAGIGAAHPPRPAPLNHVVIFKLKDPGEARELIAACERELAEIPGIVSLFCGQHLETGRTTVESGYDVCLYVGFEGREAYEGYVVHPVHTALLGQWKERFEWFRVYDVLDETE